MRIIVSDSSCLIDLKKASLLGVFLSLPYEILIPNTLFEDELLSFTAGEKRMLLQGGLRLWICLVSRCSVHERSSRAVPGFLSMMVLLTHSPKCTLAAFS
jgi:hypothetical protein